MCMGSIQTPDESACLSPFLYCVYGTLASTHLEALKENTGKIIMQNLH